jgi:tRNA-splicing ligase RtcB
MRVPGRIYADDALIEKMRTDATLQQCANVATLPGLYNYAITMPDGHEGYGFPIGGVAASDYNDGVVSPGGIGYDINCLASGTEVLTRDGFRRSIEEFATCWRQSVLKVFDLNDHIETSAPIVGYLQDETMDRNWVLRSANGRTIIATGDHPILTPSGMKPMKEISTGERVVVFPFTGVKFQQPKYRKLLKPEDFEAYSAKELQARGLLPLTLDTSRIGAIARLVGYAVGDGYISRLIVRRKDRKSPRRRFIFSLVGEPQGLEDARKDIEMLGYKPSRVYSRTRALSVTTLYKRYETIGHENKIHIQSSSFSIFMNKLGVPVGKKTRVDFDVPQWVITAPLWIKRNFLAGLFGAELTTPSTITGHPYNFQQLTLTVSKERNRKKSGVRFLLQVKKLLEDLGVSSYLTKPVPMTRRTIGVRLIVPSREENLIRLWSQIGYEYNKRRQRLASLAVEYLTTKKQHKGELKDRSKPVEFPTFERFVETCERELGPSGMVYDTVIANEPSGDYTGPVYDFTVNHKDHNFVANGLVVSNCGVRLIRTNLTEADVRPVLGKLLDSLFTNVPSGLGSRGKVGRVSSGDLEKVTREGVEWAIDHGYGWAEDRKHCEENGCMETADPDKVSGTAKQRGSPQLGSLGSGNHFLEIERVDKVFDPVVGEKLGIRKEGQVFVLVHTGSRGFGYQVCSDYLRVMERAIHKYRINLPDRQLACAPANSNEVEDYIGAMSSAANFAWVNRQMITHWTRESFEKTFGKSADQLDMSLIYDVAHNIAKIEEHVVEGRTKKVYVHRKGATRAFPPGHPAIPPEYQEIGQPVLIPGSMGTASWVLVGTPKSMELSFGTTAHGAGRFMSRAAAKRRNPARAVQDLLSKKGIMIRAENLGTVSEEAPEAYKDVDAVAEVSHQLGIGTKVARLVPIGVTKG